MTIARNARISREPPQCPSGGDLCLGQIAVSSEEGREGEGGGLVRVLFYVNENGQLANI